MSACIKKERQLPSCYEHFKTLNMKRLTILLASTAMLFAGCQTPEPEGPIDAELATIQAVMEGSVTKTTVNDEGHFAWSEGDKIWLHTTNGSIEGVLSTGAGTSNATFSYGAHLGKLTGKAVYPYGKHSISGNDLSVDLPTIYELGEATDMTNAAMYAVYIDGALNFNHLAGLMRFEFMDAPAGTNQLKITVDKKINGTFVANLADEYSTISASETEVDTEKTVTINFAPLQESRPLRLYVPLPIGTYNFLALELNSGSQTVWSYSKKVTNTINRRTLLLMPTISVGGTIDGNIEDGNLSDGGDVDGSEGEGTDTPEGEDPATPETQSTDYIDEYGINHGPGVEIDGVIWAPVNCGYHTTNYRWGKSYQWGRKFQENIDWNRTCKAPVSVQEGNNENNASVFYWGASDWVNHPDNTLWNSGSESAPIKTEYDPCPIGWRVPTYDELNTLSQNHSDWTTHKKNQPGYWYCGTCSYSDDVPQIFFPAASSTSYGSGVWDDLGYDGLYWTSKPSSDDGACILLLYEGFSSMSRSSRANGCSVRCVKDNTPLVPVSEIRFDKTSLSLERNDTYTLVAEILPSDANHQSVTWYSEDETVATVTSEGKITAVFYGQTKIVGYAGMKTVECNVIVPYNEKSITESDLIDYIYNENNYGKGTIINGTVWAPINCGGGYEDDYYFQWGNNYGYNISSNVIVGPVSSTGCDFVAWGPNYSPYGDWYSPSIDVAQWGQWGWDPCPQGWRLPTSLELEILSHNYSDWSFNNGEGGLWFSGLTHYSEDGARVFLPAYGYLSPKVLDDGTDPDDAKVQHEEYSDYGYYWSSTGENHRSAALMFCNSKPDVHSIERAYGCSIRCVQNL